MKTQWEQANLTQLQAPCSRNSVSSPFPETPCTSMIWAFAHLFLMSEKRSLFLCHLKMLQVQLDGIPVMNASLTSKPESWPWLCLQGALYRFSYLSLPSGLVVLECLTIDWELLELGSMPDHVHVPVSDTGPGTLLMFRKCWLKKNT